jgi:hypothetical protein
VPTKDDMRLYGVAIGNMNVETTIKQEWRRGLGLGPAIPEAVIDELLLFHCRNITSAQLGVGTWDPHAAKDVASRTLWWNKICRCGSSSVATPPPYANLKSLKFKVCCISVIDVAMLFIDAFAASIQDRSVACS